MFEQLQNLHCIYYCSPEYYLIKRNKSSYPEMVYFVTGNLTQFAQLFLNIYHQRYIHCSILCDSSKNYIRIWSLSEISDLLDGINNLVLKVIHHSQNYYFQIIFIVKTCLTLQLNCVKICYWWERSKGNCIIRAWNKSSL